MRTGRTALHQLIVHKQIFPSLFSAKPGKDECLVSMYTHVHVCGVCIGGSYFKM